MQSFSNIIHIFVFLRDLVFADVIDANNSVQKFDAIQVVDCQNSALLVFIAEETKAL